MTKKSDPPPSTTQERLSPVGDEPLKDKEHPDQQKLGRYTLLKELGRGGMGVVFLAWDPDLKRKVALKMLHAEPYASEHHLKWLLREARVVARLRHPNIIEIGDLDVERRFFTMRLVEGPSLARQICRQGPLTASEAATVCAQLAHALQHVHAAGVLHRDIKPDNVLMERGKPILTDFGLARELDTPQTLTQGNLQGTSAYLSPEQIRGGKAGPASDQYALGVLLYESLTGRRPFVSADPIELLRQALEGTPPALEAQGVSAGLARICRKAMAREPQDRFADMQAMAEVLERWLAGGDALSRVDDLWLRARAWLRTRRRGALIGVLGALALLVPGLLQTVLHEKRAQQRWEETLGHIEGLLVEGEHEEAQARFEAFVSQDENTNTRAHPRALLFWGREEADAGHHVNALRRLSQAYTLAQEPKLEAEILEALAEVLCAEQDYARLSTTLAVLSEEHPDHRSPALLALEAELSVALRRPQRSDDPIQAALSQATQTGHRGLDAFLWDVDNDNQDELFLRALNGNSWAQVGTEPSLPLVQHSITQPNVMPDDWAGNRMFALPFGRLAVRNRSGEAHLMLWEEEPTILVNWPGEKVYAVASADLDRDGQPEIYIGNERLLQVTQDGERWMTVDAHPPTSHSHSIIRALAVADLDGSGETLFVGTSGWGTYDVQALRWRADRLTILDRHQLGSVRDVAVIERSGQRLLAVLQTTPPDRFISMGAFGPTLPHGEPAGIHLMDLVDDELVMVEHIPMPQSSSYWPQRQHYSWDLLSGDLDGDGNSELIMRGRYAWSWTWIFSFRPDGSWRRYPMRSVRPLVLTDLDEDGDDELIVMLQEEQDGAVWVLGAGSDVLPAAPFPISRTREPAAGLDRDLAERWRRAEALVRIGLKEEAIADLTIMAQAGGGGVVWMRIAELLEAMGANTEAAQRYLSAATEAPELAPEALDGAIRCMEKERDFPEVLALIHQRLQHPDPPPALQERMTELTALVERVPLRFDFSGGVPEGWVVKTPHGVRWRAEKQGVLLRSGLGQELLSIPVTMTDEPLRIEVRLSMEDIEWAGRLYLSVIAAGVEQIEDDAMSWHMRGGGGVYHASFNCPDLLDAKRRHERAPEAFLGEQTVRIEHSPREGQITCSFAIGDNEPEVLHYRSNRFPTGNVELVFHSPDVHATTDVLLREISLTGVTTRAQAAIPTLQANRLLAEHQPDDALATLRGLGSEDALLAAVTAHAELGHLHQAGQLLERVLVEVKEPERILKRMLFISPEIFAPLLQEHLGAHYYTLFYDVYSTRAHAHPTAKRTIDPLLRHLDGILGVPLAALPTTEERLSLLALLRLRAGAYRHQVRLTAAQQHLRRAEAFREALTLGTLTAKQAVLFSTEQSQLSWERARLLTVRGDYADAIDFLLLSIAQAPSPIPVADAIAHDTSLSALHEHPSWVRLERLRESPALTNP